MHLYPTPPLSTGRHLEEEEGREEGEREGRRGKEREGEGRRGKEAYEKEMESISTTQT